MTDGTGTSTYAFDSLGRTTSQSTGAGATVGYTVDLAGQVTGISYPGGAGSVTRHFDPAGRLTSVADWNGNSTAFTYDANSNLLTTVLPNGITGTNAYDQADQETGISYATSSTPVAGFAYTLNADGDVTQETDSGIDTAAPAVTYNPARRVTGFGSDSYSYTAAGQVTSTPSMASTGYDPAGELCWASSSVTTGTCASPPLLATVYSYNNTGQRIGQWTIGGSTGYSWNAPGELTSITSSGGPALGSYTYNGDGLRAAKTVLGTTTQFTYNTTGTVPQILAQNAGGTTTDFIYGLGATPIEQLSGSTASYLLSDRLGSVRALTDSTGTVISSYEYDAYGNQTVLSGTATASPLGFTGGYTDAESGLLYLDHRYYDPSTSQFLSVDPLLASTHDPFGYAADNPVNAVDPTGYGPQTTQGRRCSGSLPIARGETHDQACAAARQEEEQGIGALCRGAANCGNGDCGGYGGIRCWYPLLILTGGVACVAGVCEAAVAAASETETVCLVFLIVAMLTSTSSNTVNGQSGIDADRPKIVKVEPRLRQPEQTSGKAGCGG